MGTLSLSQNIRGEQHSLRLGSHAINYPLRKKAQRKFQ
ncbi:hypothetical protein CURTO8I2_70407 [Curtobacterium sp. 8I-2]|nr:hypothetical protein CURTO8I2_70407 [Curtobacterium sp. 8I-2]